MNIDLLSILMDALFIMLLLWCSYTDIKNRTISNLSITILLVLDICHFTIVGLTLNPWWSYPASMLFGIPFFISWTKNNIGAGDVKLVMVISFYLGIWSTIIAFILMIPAIAVLIIKELIKTRMLKHQMPFAPVLSFGAIAVVLFGHFYIFI